MRKIILFLIISMVLAMGFAQSDEVRVPTSIMTAESQVIAPYGVASAEFVSVDFGVADEVFYGPAEIDVQIRSGYQTTALFVNLASRVNTKVKIVISNPEMVVSNEKLDSYPLYSGVQQTVNMVAFGPHSGTITILNEEDKVLAVVPYTVRNENEFRHSVNGNISTSGAVSFSYTLSSSRGCGMSSGIQIDNQGNVSGSVGGSYSW